VLPGAGVRDNATEVAAGGAPSLAGLPSGTVVVRRSTEPESYTVPTARPFAVSVASAQLANYVVAHSEFSGPLARRNVLAALVASESVPIAPPAGSKTADQASAAAAPSDAAGQR
jgi:hypothetical protein